MVDIAGFISDLTALNIWLALLNVYLNAFSCTGPMLWTETQIASGFWRRDGGAGGAERVNAHYDA
jgi:hypothetical protein